MFVPFCLSGQTDTIGSCPYTDYMGCGCSIVEDYQVVGSCPMSSTALCVNDYTFTEICGVSLLENSSIIYGCTNSNAFNYDTLANVDDGSCVSYTIGAINHAFDAWNISIDLSSGWNMFGYGCPTPIDLVEGLSNHTDKITIVKDNNGNVYMPEFGFSGIGDLTPGYGYQIKVTEEINDFSLCDWYVNDIPEDNIVSLQEEVEYMSQFFGCVDISACNYDETAVLDDETCEYAEEGYDCDGNLFIHTKIYVYTSQANSSTDLHTNYNNTMGIQVPNTPPSPSTLLTDIIFEETNYTTYINSKVLHNVASGNILGQNTFTMGSSIITRRATINITGPINLNKALQQLGGVDMTQAGTSEQILIIFPATDDISGKPIIMTDITGQPDTHILAINVNAGFNINSFDGITDNFDYNAFGAIQFSQVNVLTLDNAHEGYANWYVIGQKGKLSLNSAEFRVIEQ